MNEEQQKIESYLAEIGKKINTNPGLVAERPFFESWEMAYKPRPFLINGTEIQLSGHALQFAPKGKFIAWLGWDMEQQRPVFRVENDKRRHAFSLAVKGKALAFQPAVAASPRLAANDAGEETEVAYDVIDHLITLNPCAEVLKISRTEFIQALTAISTNYDEKLIKKMSKYSAAKIKSIIKQAAEDMAMDELSAQVGLPSGDSYAFDPENQAPPLPPQIIPPKTRWEIIQEIELLLAMTQYNYKFQKEFIIQLKNCEIMAIDGPHKSLIRIPHMKNAGLQEGSKLTVQFPGVKGSLGVFNVGMFDYDTIYGDIQWDNPDDIQRINDLQLIPRKGPGKIVTQKMEALYHAICNSKEPIAGALSGILGFTEMTLDSSTGTDSALDTELYAEMDFSQKRAFSAAIHPNNPVVAVQGPPGTGKTWVLVRIIWRLCQQGKRILVVAPSNTAVDNICKRISDLPLLRLGSPDKVDPQVKDTCWFGNPSNIETYLEKRKTPQSGAVYATTQMRSLFDDLIAKELNHYGLFDAVLFDEAGMSHMDEFILCSKMGRRVIVFGDQQQLPPFPLSDKVLDQLNRQHRYTASGVREIIDCSALEWLAQNRKLEIFMLQSSYRCQNPRLLRFSSTLFYHARVKTSKTAEYLRLPYHARKERYPRATLRFYSTSLLPESTRREKFVVENQLPGIENPCEALICQQVLLESLAIYDLAEIMIITPYKAQVKRIKQLLREDAVRALLPVSVSAEAWDSFIQAKIATVDSFQGGESDLVIISYVRSNQNRGIGFVDNPNRINVAHTRCKRSLIIIGDLACLKAQAQTDIFHKMEQTFARDGEIIQATNIGA